MAVQGDGRADREGAKAVGGQEEVTERFEDMVVILEWTEKG